MIDIKVTLHDGTEYIIENFQSIIFNEDDIVIIGEYKYSFKNNEIFIINIIEEQLNILNFEQTDR